MWGGEAPESYEAASCEERGHTIVSSSRFAARSFIRLGSFNSPHIARRSGNSFLRMLLSRDLLFHREQLSKTERKREREKEREREMDHHSIPTGFS